MASIRVSLAPVVRTSQPQFAARVDWSNPLAKGLSFVWNGSQPFFEVVSSASGTTTNVADQVVGRAGRAIYVGVQGSLDFADQPAFNVTGDITAFALVSPISLGADTSAFAKAASNGATNTPFDFGLNSGQIRLGRANGGYRVWASAGASIPTGVPSTIAASQSSDISTNPIFYYSGKRDVATPSSLYGGGGTGAAGATTAPVKIGNRGDLVTPASGPVYLCLLWNRVLSDAEHAQLAANPWQIFK